MFNGKPPQFRQPFAFVARGFTLVELMVVVSILALLVSLAAPSFTRLLTSNAVSSQVNDFMADARFARSEAMRRGLSVIMCPSDSPEDANPVCTENTKGAVNWNTGWITFVNNDANSKYDSATDTLLRVHQPLSRVAIQSGNADSTPSSVRYNAAGLGVTPTNLVFTPVNNLSADDSMRRQLCISFVGRIRVNVDAKYQPKVEATCST